MAPSVAPGVEDLIANLPAHEADVLLITRLVLQDIEEHKILRKGKNREGSPLSDETIAFDLLSLEADSVLSVIRDGILARSIDEAVSTDRDLLQELYDLEITARDDREMALAVARGDSRGSVRSSSVASPFGESSSHLSFSPTSTKVFESESVEEIGSMVEVKPSGSQRTGRQDCIICGDTIRGRHICTPCGHYYDWECARDLFEASTRDESLYPPRCCRQPIPLDLMRGHLSLTFIARFEEKGREFTTPNRLYCSTSSCSRFLGPATDAITAIRCPSCRRNTCTACKAAAHPAHIPCATDEAAQAVLSLARESGWQQCPSCHHMVELAVGCYHMTCRCNHSFCYICAAPWKTCGCPQWDEGRLILAARQQVERERRYGDVEVPRAEVPRMLEQAVERLRLDHDCAHQNWGYRHGGGRCESCGFNLPQYLLRCRGCQMLACVRCQRNRL